MGIRQVPPLHAFGVQSQNLRDKFGTDAVVSARPCAPPPTRALSSSLLTNREKNAPRFNKNRIKNRNKKERNEIEKNENTN
ncbi:hypothetical protein [Methanolapillus africanus]|uniref:hypothetical protein n=1 Tax=Methanolapillus africanus TaxID=3028297 RepID=UPI0030B88FB2